jgi:(hydroxyamino)benzene mutase
VPPIESTIEIAASPDRRPRLRDRPHTVRRVARRRGERLDGQVQLGLLVSAAWRASRCRDVGLVLMSLTVIPISDLVIWLIAASRLTKAPEHLTGVLILPIGAHIAADDRGRASVHGHVARPSSSWKIVVFGAGGATGRQLVAHALQRGHKVAAFVRSSTTLPSSARRLTIVRGDVRDADAVGAAVEGQDAVVCALGAATPLRRDTALAEGMPNIVAATSVTASADWCACRSSRSTRPVRSSASLAGGSSPRSLGATSSPTTKSRGESSATGRSPGRRDSPTPGAEERIEARRRHPQTRPSRGFPGPTWRPSCCGRSARTSTCDRRPGSCPEAAIKLGRSVVELTRSELARQSHHLLQVGVGLFLFSSLWGFVIPLLRVRRLGLSVHTLSALEGIILIGLGLLWPRLALGTTSSRVAFWFFVYSTLATLLPYVLAAVWGAGDSVIPLAAGGARGSRLQEAVITGVLYTAAPTVLISLTLILWGLRGPAP